MSKYKELVQDDNDDSVGNKIQGPPVKLTHVAMGMCNVPGEGWSVVKIKYDPVTGTVGTIKKKYTGEIRPYIEEKLRIETVEEDIFNNCQNPWRTDS